MPSGTIIKLSTVLAALHSFKSFSEMNTFPKYMATFQVMERGEGEGEGEEEEEVK